SWRDERGRGRFKLALSIEKDANAHATLRLRAFRRCFGETTPEEYDRVLRGEAGWEELKSCHTSEARRAEDEARQIELGRESVSEVRSLIRRAVPDDDSPWVLIGGPP